MYDSVYEPAMANVSEAVDVPVPLLSGLIPEVGLTDQVNTPGEPPCAVMVTLSPILSDREEGVSVRADGVVQGGATTVKLVTADADPPMVVTRAVTLTVPGVKVREVHDQLPAPDTDTTQGTLPGATTVTLLFGVAVPLTTG